ncbi:uncharacterized protein [Ptychodera flava]|uniref:uncharacterized protein n=1 Tax=Ptychodera flava TaxID=63121 RepID=UPI003969EC65
MVRQRDSSTLLNSDKKLPVFIAYRFKEVRGISCTAKYCPTKENPADLLTKGISARILEKNKFWWNGPSWLHRGDWPISELFDSAIHHVSLSTARDDDLLANSDQTGDNKIVNEPEREMPATGIQFIVDANRCSKLPKLLRVSALVLRFVSNLKKSAVRKRGPITADEIQHAEHVWIKHIQQETYGRRSVQQKRQFATTEKQLKLFADESGILRCDGRLQNAPIGYDTKFPILLPNNHRFTYLLILDAHSQLLHAGVQSTVTNLQQRFWIPKLRHTARFLLRRCVTCRKISGTSYTYPVQIPLQTERVNITPPFTVTGVDFTGALYIKSTKTVRDTKVYACLFTCAVTQVVHLELVTYLSSRGFLQAFRRFCGEKFTSK